MSIKRAQTRRISKVVGETIKEADFGRYYLNVEGQEFRLPDRLLGQLCRLASVVDLSQLLLNRQVAVLTSGVQFGDLALNSKHVRQASIYALTPCVLVYIELDEYQRVVKRALKMEQQLKMQFVRANRLFTKMSTGRLEKLSYQMKQVKLCRKQTLYKEGDVVDGIYIIQSGTLSYSIKVPYAKPIQASTQNKWFEEKATALGVNQRSMQRQLAIFSTSAFIGFEELFRQFMMETAAESAAAAEEMASPEGKVVATPKPAER